MSVSGAGPKSSISGGRPSGCSARMVTRVSWKTAGHICEATNRSQIIRYNFRWSSFR